MVIYRVNVSKTPLGRFVAHIQSFKYISPEFESIGALHAFVTEYVSDAVSTQPYEIEYVFMESSSCG